MVFEDTSGSSEKIHRINKNKSSVFLPSIVNYY